MECKCKCKKKKILVGAGAGVLLAAGIVIAIKKCKKTIPTGLEAVSPFDSKRYLGKWYEIARMDFHYEKHMSQVTAEYSLMEDGNIKVVNRGFDEKKDVWEESEGKAKFVDSPEVGKLKVSFFGPFYAGYNVIAIDPEYKYALVAGRNRDYLWILSREKTIPEDVKQKYLDKACESGYDVSKLVWTDQK